MAERVISSSNTQLQALVLNLLCNFFDRDLLYFQSITLLTYFKFDVWTNFNSFSFN
ncbi:conserved hypothetical protein [Ricinus communis]|uniref:Uncharacterized protein n=1 Tax=Ricinus communis TaxID=3988 RepID=B9RJ18_RICCO|nr:conserved hypothetical protein [Ricinus communis]